MNRNRAIDYMKFLAIYLVVCNHSICFNGSVIQNKIVNFIVVNFPRFVIPFFFVVAGFFLGSKIKADTFSKEDFYKYVSKLIKLFIAWYLFYFLYDIGLRILTALKSGESIKVGVISYLKTIPHFSTIYYGVGLTSFHLWFLTALIWSIIILYFFVYLKKLKFLLIFSLTLNCFGVFVQNYHEALDLNLQTRDALFFGLFYTTLGCYIAIHYTSISEKIKSVKNRTLFLTIFLLIGLQILEKRIGEMLGNQHVFPEYYFSTIPLIFFLFLLLLKNGSIGRDSIISNIGKLAVGIYVFHMFFISIVYISLNSLGIAMLRQNILFHLTGSLFILFLSYFTFVILQVSKIKLSYLLRMTLFKRRGITTIRK